MGVELKPLSQIAREMRDECEKEIHEYKLSRLRGVEADIKRVENVRLGMSLLASAGLLGDVSRYVHRSGRFFTIDLGFFPGTKKGRRELAKKVRAIRLALDSQLGNAYKQLASAERKTVTWTLTAKQFEGISVTYETKLPRGSKCKIVTEKRTTKELVCRL